MIKVRISVDIMKDADVLYERQLRKSLLSHSILVL